MFRGILSGIMTILALGVIVMVFRAFGWDIFGVIEWLFQSALRAIEWVADGLARTRLWDWLQLS